MTEYWVFRWIECIFESGPTFCRWWASTFIKKRSCCSDLLCRQYGYFVLCTTLDSYEAWFLFGTILFFAENSQLRTNPGARSSQRKRTQQLLGLAHAAVCALCNVIWAFHIVSSDCRLLIDRTQIKQMSCSHYESSQSY